MISLKFKPARRRFFSVVIALAVVVSNLTGTIGGTGIAYAASAFSPSQAVQDHLNQDDWANIQSNLANIYGSITTPLTISKVSGTRVYTQGQLMSNGDIGALAAGVSTTSQQFYLSKNDFWGYPNSVGIGVMSCGGLDIWPTTAAGSQAASVFNMKQDILNAEVITNIQLKDNAGNDATVQMNSWTADTDNVFVAEVKNNGNADITLNTKLWMPKEEMTSTSAADLSDAINTYPYSGGIDTSGANPVLWVTRDTNAGVTGNTNGNRTRIAEATTVLGAQLTNTQEKIAANDYYRNDKNKYYNSLGEQGDFTIPAGGTVQVVTFLKSSSGAYAGIDSVSKVQQDAVTGLAAYSTPEAIAQLKADHREWWKNYWLKSYVQFNDADFNKFYYGSLYIQGCCNRAASTDPKYSKVEPKNIPASLYGPWVPADNQGWGGKYVLNYNQEAQYYAAGSTNRADTILPYSHIIAYDKPFQINNTLAQGFNGLAHTRTLVPFNALANPQPSLNSKSSTKNYAFNSGSTDQKSNGTFAAAPMIMYYQYTLDDNYLKTVLYPYLKELLTFYSDYVLKQDDGNGQYHYSVIGSSIHEGDSADINPDLDIGAIKFLSKFLTEHSSEMSEDPANIDRWQDLYDHTAYPEAMLPKGTFSASNIGNLVPTLLATDYQSPNQAHVDIIEPGDQPVELEGVVFPIQNVQMLDGDKELLQKVLNTLDYMNAWSATGFSGWSSQNNGFCKVFPVAARAGWPAADLLSKFRTTLNSTTGTPAEARMRASNLTYYQTGGAVETIGAMEMFDSMVLQSSTTPSVPSTIWAFPNWDSSKSASYEKLGAMGNVEVSSRYDATALTVQYVDLNSKRDGKIALVNPWTTGKPVIQIVNQDKTLGADVSYTIKGGKIIFDAAKDTRYMVMNDTSDATVHVSDMSLDKYSSTLIYNGTNGVDTATVSATVSGKSDDVVTWTSSDSSIVSVTDNGNNTATIKAVGVGENKVSNVTVVAKSTQDPDITQTLKVKVADVSTVPTGITMLSPDSATIYGPGSTSAANYKVSGTDRLQLTASVQPENAYDRRIQWSSSNQNLAMVDKNGLVIARGQGTVTITGTSMANPGLPPVTCTVTIVAPGSDYKADPTLLNVIKASRSISAFKNDVTGNDGSFVQISTSPKWEGNQEAFQRALINALGVKAGYSGYSSYKISKDTAYFTAVALNEAIKTIDPTVALAVTYVADKSLLSKAITQGLILTRSNFYTDADWTNFQTALAAAQTLNGDPNVKQEAVDKAFTDLNTAMGKVKQTGGYVPSVSFSAYSGSYIVYGGHFVQLNALGSGLAWTVKNSDGSATTDAVVDPIGGMLYASKEGTYIVTAKPSSGTSTIINVTFSNMSPISNLTVNGNGNGNAFGQTKTGSYNCTMPFDGSASTFYEAKVTTPYVGWDFGAPQIVNVLKFVPRTGSNALRSNGVRFQGSNNDTDYTDLYTISGISNTSSTQPWYMKPLNNTAAYRYYRWLSLDANYANVAEIQLYINVDKTALGTKIANAQSLQEDNYTDESWQKLQTALVNVEDVYDSPAAQQSDIDASAVSLQGAVDGLQVAPGSALEVANGITSIMAPAKDALSLTLPTVPEGCSIVIKSSNKTGIIDANRNITPPDLDTTVNLVLTVTKTATGTTVDTVSIPVIVPAGTSASEIAAGITSIAAPAQDVLKLVLPTVPGNFTVAVLSTDNSAVIDTNGNIMPLSIDTTVNLVLRVTKLGSSATADTVSIPVIVPLESTPEEIVAGITSIIAPAKDALKLVLPTVPGNFTLAITSSDNQEVIDTNGNITPPAIETTVNLVLTVTKTASGAAAVTASIPVVVPAESTAAEIAAGINSITAPAKDASTLALPSVPAKFALAIKSTDNSDVIDETGKIVHQADDTTVNLVLEVTRLSDQTKADTVSIPVLVPAKDADKTVLVSKMNSIQTLQAGNYTDESWQQLQTALANAVSVNANPLVGQTTVNVCAASLQSAIDGLQAAPGSALEVANSITAIDAPAKDAMMLTLPAVPTGCAIKIQSSDSVVIGRDGYITLPSVDTTVNLVLRVTNTASGTIADTVTIPVIVPAGTKATEVADGITSIAAPAKYAVKLALPTVPDLFTIAIKSTDNSGVIDTNGNIAIPGDDTTVNLVFEVTRKSDETKAVTASIEVLVPAGDANKVPLAREIGDAQTKQEGNYTVDSWQQLQTALANANTVIDNPDAQQSAVSTSTTNLHSAIVGLQVAPGSPLDIANGITSIAAPAKDAVMLTLPTVSTDCEIKIQSSDNVIINTAGRITLPNVDTTVNLVLRVTNIASGTTADTASIPVIVPAGTSAADIANGITSIAAPAKDAVSLVLPDVPTGFSIAIKSSDNTGVINTSGSITPPTVNTTVNLVLEVTRTLDGSKADTVSIAVAVPAKTVINTGGSGPSSSSDGSAQDTTKVPVVEVGKVNAIPELVTNTATAAISIDAAILSKALEQAPKDTDGIKKAIIELAKVEGATAYTTELAKEVLTSSGLNNKVEIKTEIASLVVPSNMLNAADITASSKVELSIEKADTSNMGSGIQVVVGNRPVIELNVKVDGKQIAWNNPNTEVTVSIPYVPTVEELKAPEFIVVKYIDPNGKFVAIPSGRYDAASRSVIFSTTHFSKYAVGFVRKTFNDTADVSWAQKQIEVLASKGIIGGTSETTYTPKANITRADFLVLLMRTLGLTAKVDSNFNDVAPTDNYYNAIGTAKALGIVKGAGNNMFKPNTAITRQDMMVMVAQGMKVAKQLNTTGTSKDLDKFKDKSRIAGYAVESAATLVKEGIINGSNGFISPASNVTRAETAVVMYNIYNRVFAK